MSSEAEIKRAVTLLRSGDKVGARKILVQLLKADPNDPVAWAALSQAAQSRDDAAFCLKQVLRLKPGDSWATQHLERLQPQTSKASKPAKVKARTTAKVSVESAPGDGAKSSSLVMTAVGALIVILVFVLGYTAINEFFISYEDERDVILRSAHMWTVAWYRTDYETMSQLACRPYASQVERVPHIDQLTRDLVVSPGIAAELADLQVPRGLQYEVVYQQGRTAHVKVTGFSTDLRTSLRQLGMDTAQTEPLFKQIDERTYVMTREGDWWKWCGEK